MSEDSGEVEVEADEEEEPVLTNTGEEIEEDELEALQSEAKGADGNAKKPEGW